MTIGTPPQPVALLVDAQATNIEVMYPGLESENCSEYRYCAFYGQFDPRNSSSFSSDVKDWRELPDYFVGIDTLGVGESKPLNVSLELVPVDGFSSCEYHPLP